jgi:hypothetical protein
MPSHHRASLALALCVSVCISRCGCFASPALRHRAFLHFALHRTATHPVFLVLCLRDMSGQADSHHLACARHTLCNSLQLVNAPQAQPRHRHSQPVPAHPFALFCCGCCCDDAACIPPPESQNPQSAISISFLGPSSFSDPSPIFFGPVSVFLFLFRWPASWFFFPLLATRVSV